MSRVSKNKFVKGIAAGGIVLASLGTLTLGNYQIQQPAESDETEASAPAAAQSGTAAPAQASAQSGTDGASAPVIPADAEFVPGTYTASATGMESQVTVEAIFDEH